MTHTLGLSPISAASRGRVPAPGERCGRSANVMSGEGFRTEAAYSGRSVLHAGDRCGPAARGWLCRGPAVCNATEAPLMHATVLARTTHTRSKALRGDSAGPMKAVREHHRPDAFL